MRLTGSKRLAASAFTLLELLVVISIIALLAGILLPVTGSVMESARRADAKNTATQIVTAIKSYQTDYGVYPVVPGGTAPATPTDTTFDQTTNGGNTPLFGILRATDAVASSPNTRRVVYFEGKDVKNPTKPTSGFATQQATTTINGNAFTVSVGQLVDPWGVGYMVRYDTGYDDAVMLPEADGSNTPGQSTDSTSATTNGTTTNVLRFGVIAWSYGKDGQYGKGGSFGTSPNYTYGDDVVSWQ